MDTDLKKLEFEKALDLRNFEIDKFWIRAWFFGALLVAIAGAHYELAKEKTPDHYCLYLSFLAFLVSVAQCLMNRGSKYWQERWEYHTKHKESALGIDVTKTEGLFITSDRPNGYREKDLIEAYILAKDENCLTRSSRLSVSKLTILVWDIIALFCLGLWIKDSNILLWFDFNIIKCSKLYELRFCAFAFHFVVILYILYFLFKKRKGWFDYKDGGGGKVYEKLGKNLTVHGNKLDGNPDIISRAELQKIYEAGKF